MTLRSLALLVLALAVPTLARGQSSTAAVQTLQNLGFGMLIPGRPEHVTISDVQRRGTVEISGRGHIRVTFLLPQALTSPTGATLGITFGPTDGGVIYPQSAVPEPFSPELGTSINLNRAHGNARVVLGATLAVPLSQPAGDYSGVVRVVLSDPNL